MLKNKGGIIHKTRVVLQPKGVDLGQTHPQAPVGAQSRHEPLP